MELKKTLASIGLAGTFSTAAVFGSSALNKKEKPYLEKLDTEDKQQDPIVPQQEAPEIKDTQEISKDPAPEQIPEPENKPTTPISTKTEVRSGSFSREKLLEIKEIKDKISSILSSQKNKRDCNANGGEWSGNKCVIPEKIEKTITIDSSSMGNYKNLDDCHKNGGYFSSSCRKPGIDISKQLDKEISKWKTKELKDPGENKPSLNHLYKEKYFELREDNKKFVLVALKDKLIGDLEDWDFPKHFIYDKAKNKGVKLEDFCIWLQQNNDGYNLDSYIYNEKKETWWNCNYKRTVIFVKN